MSDNITAAIIGLAGVFIGAFLSFGIQRTYDHFTKPKLIINHDELVSGNDSYIHSIRITNAGGISVKNCIALLTITNLEKSDVIIHPKAFLHPDSYRDVIDEPLSWALETYHYTGVLVPTPFIDIYPQSSQLLDLCMILYDKDGNPTNIQIPSEAGWNWLRGEFKANKNYEVEIKLNAENVRFSPNKHSVKFTIYPKKKEPYI